MASFEKRGNGIRAIVSFPDGRRQATFDTMAEARAWAAEMEKAKELGNVKHSKVRTVEQLIIDYLPLAKHTDSGKWNELRLLKLCNDPLAKVALHQITPHEINEWSGRRLQEIKPASVNRELNLIRDSMFTHGVKVRKWLNENPCWATRPGIYVKPLPWRQGFQAPFACSLIPTANAVFHAGAVPMLNNGSSTTWSDAAHAVGAHAMLCDCSVLRKSRYRRSVRRNRPSCYPYSITIQCP